MEPRGTELITRYKRTYLIPEEIEVTEQMILDHWELEKELTQKLLKSTTENRFLVFEKAYTRLYSQLEWLNQFADKKVPIKPEQKYAAWVETIGLPPQKIYEIGSGKGELITYLATLGFQCKGTEITQERGQKHQQQSLSSLFWGNSDGVHLDKFEAIGSYDVVISNQVIEHLHPDDLIEHLAGSYKILTERGRYIFSTPHCHTGPHDISQVFKYDQPQGMHLKEYTYGQLVEAAHIAGFRQVYRVTPSGIRQLLAKIGIDQEEQIIRVGKSYLNLMLGIEQMIFGLPSQNLRRQCSQILRKFLIFADNIFLVLQK